MKNSVKAFIAVYAAILLAGCYDRDVVDHKEFDYSLPQIENLNYTKQANQVHLTWQIPANIPADFKRPLETQIQVVENDVYKNIVTVGNEIASADIDIDASKEYRFVVRLYGQLTDDAAETGWPEEVYSQSRVIEIR
ncbi:MAG: DUF4945 domain-containing protein [Bacteroidales bacterium]|nr:DUF4945 domain-containing protein [Bacteroidales bacterium]